MVHSKKTQQRPKARTTLDDVISKSALARGAMVVVVLAGACQLGVATGFASAQSENAPARAPVAQLPATRIPATWSAFAARVQTSFQQRLAGKDDAALQFQDFLGKRFDRPGTPPPSVIVRAWIGPDGKVERLEFEGVFDLDVIVNLRAVLVTADVGAPPPVEMPQPLRLRLSLGHTG